MWWDSIQPLKMMFPKFITKTILTVKSINHAFSPFWYHLILPQASPWGNKSVAEWNSWGRNRSRRWYMNPETGHLLPSIPVSAIVRLWQGCHVSSLFSSLSLPFTSLCFKLLRQLFLPQLHLLDLLSSAPLSLPCLDLSFPSCGSA